MPKIQPSRGLCRNLTILLKEVSTKFYKHFRLSLYTVRSVVREKSVTYITEKNLNLMLVLITH